MESEYNLKPCPFCGNKAELIVAPGYFKSGLSSSGWLVKCTNGCCNQMPHMSGHDAVEAWNRRETRGYIEQIKWERDLAIRQLADLGYGLGEKPRTNGDTISRQLAIDALEQDEKYNEDIPLRADGVRDAIITISALPSEQPEIIYCKDCMYTDGDKPIADGRYWCMLHGTFMYYCSDAERGSDETNRRRQATGR